MTKDEALKLLLEALEINLVFLKNVKPFKGQEDLASDCVLMSEETITAIKEALAKEKALQALHDENERLGLYKYAYAEQEPLAWKLVPIKPTDEMLKALDECSMEGYDERLYARHAASVYMAAVDVAPTPSAQRKPLTDEHPLVVFAKECVLGAYKESELGDAARRAIEAAYNIKGEA